MENNINNQNNINLNNQSNLNSGVSNNGATSQGSQNTQNISQTATPNGVGSRPTYAQSTYLKPEDFVKDAPAKPVTPVFAYSKTVQNPYLPQGYQTTTTLSQPTSAEQQTGQNGFNPASPSPAQPTQANTSAQNQQPAGSQTLTAKNMQESVGEGLSFGNQPAENAPVGGGFELVGNKASQREIAKGAKFKSHRRTESRFCGHSAWFFSFANLFVCLLFLLCNILISNATEEMIAAGGTIATIQAILDKSPYVTLVVLAFTLIAIINSIIQITIANNKYSKLTICFVLGMNALMFTYLYLAGFITKTFELLQLATS